MPIVIAIIGVIILYNIWDDLFIALGGIFGLLGLLAFLIAWNDHKASLLTDEEFKAKYPEQTERRNSCKTFLVLGIIFCALSTGAFLFQTTWSEVPVQTKFSLSEIKSLSDDELTEKIQVVETNLESNSTKYWLANNLHDLLGILVGLGVIILIASLIFFRAFTPAIFVGVLILFIVGSLSGDLKKSAQSEELTALKHERSARQDKKAEEEKLAAERAEQAKVEQEKLAAEKTEQEKNSAEQARIAAEQKAEQDKISRWGDKVQVKNYLEKTQPFALANGIKNESGIIGSLVGGEVKELKTPAFYMSALAAGAKKTNTEVVRQVAIYFECKAQLANAYATAKNDKRGVADRVFSGKDIFELNPSKIKLKKKFAKWRSGAAQI